jgi:hypothetical protein
MYYDFAFDGQYDLGPGIYAVTIICDTTNYCTDNGNQPLASVNKAYIRANASSDGLPDAAGPLQVAVFAHETGHALGEVHTTRLTDLMYAYVDTTPTSPVDAGDIGAKPGCSGSLGSTNSNNERAGVRCVFGYDS